VVGRWKSQVRFMLIRDADFVETLVRVHFMCGPTTRNTTYINVVRDINGLGETVFACILYVKQLIISKYILYVKQLIINKYILYVKQLIISKYFLYVKQLIISKYILYVKQLIINKYILYVK
jgi:hypothetical protein